jgi:carbamoyltransferase
MMETVLGVNAYHGDASAALLVDGECVAAAEEERFTRVKHQSGFPTEAVRWCLEEADVRPGEIDHVAIGRNPAANIYRKASYALVHPPSVGFLRSRLSNAAHVLDAPAALAEALDTPREAIGAKFHRVEHHRSHLASAFFCSPFDDAACITLDGMGDFVSTMWARGRANAMRVGGAVVHPHSLGHFYQAFTQFLGLHKYGDEYKLMGLASYGEPRFGVRLRDVLSLERGLQFRLNLDYFRHHKRGIDMTWRDGTPEVGPMWSPKMVEVFGPPREFASEVTQRDEDLAASVQVALEMVALEIIRRLHRRTGSPRLIMAGGVALNCVLNGKILASTPFEEVWIQPASNDAGISIGAALWAWNQILGRERTWVMGHALLGPQFEEVDYKRALEDVGLSHRWLPDEELFDYVASRIAAGAVVGWFQGEMEFGPRALGNRSIVCDPRMPEMKEVLNARIKHREPFRPFAPSILAERTDDWFEQSYPSPFMLMAYDVKPERRHLIPAVTHVDGTGRLQTVERNQNERYYSLIEAFERRTGVPVVLNTSFNENEPICCRPEEAVDCFQRTHMDVLVLGNYITERESAGTTEDKEETTLGLLESEGCELRSKPHALR